MQTQLRKVAPAAGAARAPLPQVALACTAVAALTLLLPSTPTYDPWSWLVWGREIAGLGLDTSEGPAFKPLPVAIATLLAPAGTAAPWLWLLVARASALLAAALAWRLASRLAGGSRVAGALAGAGVLLTGGWIWNGALGNAEGLFLALVLLAAERTLAGHERQALLLATAAALVRTEAVPFVALYAIWLWRRDHAARPYVAAALLALPALWLCPDLLSTGDPLRSSERARIPNPGAPALADRPALESLTQSLPLAPLPLVAGAALALAAVRRRELPRLAALPAAAAAAWIALVAAMSELGYSGEPRYAMPGAALLAVSGGAGIAWALRRARGRMARGAIAASVAVAAAAAVYPLPADLRDLGHDARLYGAVDDAVAAAGGRAAVLRAGPVHTAPYSRPAFAWRLRVPISSLSTDRARGGIAFRARTVAGAPPGPPLASGPWRHTGRAGQWRVLEHAGAAR